MFSTVLIANRGEIALRAMRTLRRMDIRSVAVYADADRDSAHVDAADMAIALGGVRPAESYLRIDKLIDACRQSGAEAVFPGYGFLSESAEFSEACEATGVVFIGPTPAQMRDFGLKHRSRELAALADVPLTPGTKLLSSMDEALEAAERLGYPVMLKSTAGGGGIGLSRCTAREELIAAYESVQRLGLQFFRDGGVFLERYIDRARHIEVQIFGDGEGRVAALGERDCSIQRRNQKVVEETPAPNLNSATRAALLSAAVKLGKAVNYRSAGTVEFIYDTSDRNFYFLEVNTRLQVEHPVTEMVTGHDLVECMVRVAAGEPLDWDALHRAPQGAAMEVRIYAEDPARNFQPSPGTLTEVHFPEGVRVDGWVETGTQVSPYYDPMLAKLIVYGATREEARERLSTALGATRLHGIETNLDYLRAIVAARSFASGDMTTRFLDSFEYHAPAIEVLEPGTYTTVQDYPGRTGYWDVGVPPSGPMDDYAFRLANRIVGNPSQAAALECTLEGPTLRFYSDAVIALTGAETLATLDGQAMAMWLPVNARAGQVLAVGRATSGCRTYLAVRNGLDVPVYLGSQSTFVLGQFGGHGGRILCSGDMLWICNPKLASCTTPAPTDSPRALPKEMLPSYSSPWEIAVLYGPHGAPDYFTLEAMEAFFAADWEVHYNSNRLGVRLTGPKPEWARSSGGEAGLHPSNVHDCEYALGSINFTGDSPVILTRDGPSLGGFVCPVTIVKAELWKVGQVKPGDRIRFVPMQYNEALDLEHAQERRLQTFEPEPVRPPSPRPSLLSGQAPATLAERNADGHHPKAQWRQAGDNYILLEYGEDVLDLASRLRVHLLMEAIRAEKLPVEELSPGVRSLQIRYDSSRIEQPALMQYLLRMEETLPDVAALTIPTRIVHLPMAFEDSATLGAIQRYRETVRSQAPWLPSNVEFLRRVNGLETTDEVREIIHAARYMVLGLGDVYLGAPCAVPVDPRHRLLSSKYNPARSFTAEGTVGIGGMYMCIYGMDSPGGYQLVGRTLPIWNKFLKNPQFENGQPWLLRFFDQVCFYPVEEAELTEQREAFRRGRHRIRIEEEIFDYGAYRQFLDRHQRSIAAFRERQQAAFTTEIANWKDHEAASAVKPSPAAAAVEERRIPDGHRVHAPMHGSVWKLLAQVGERVEANQAIFVVEAMKMELIVSAPTAGVIKAICCATGHSVATGDILAVIEP